MRRKQELCKICKINKQDNKGKAWGYRTTCKTCWHNKRRPKLKCNMCGFVPEHSCQMDIDHIDENHFNNEEKTCKFYVLIVTG